MIDKRRTNWGRDPRGGAGAGEGDGGVGVVIDPGAVAEPLIGHDGAETREFGQTSRLGVETRFNWKLGTVPTLIQ